MKILGRYKNGNYTVTIFDDGTKIRENDLDTLEASFPESMDVNISNQCVNGCPFCYLNATSDGCHGRFDYKFFEDLQPYTELAINLNSYKKLPEDFENWLQRMKEKKIIVNATINQNTLSQSYYYEKVKQWQDENLINALGISLSKVDEDLLLYLKTFKNTVLHVICGLIKEEELDLLTNKNIRVLFLGYKTVGRGVEFLSDDIKNQIEILSSNITKRLSQFKVCSFDNLALQQLQMKEKIDSERWKESYMGDDGCYSMYIDLVSGTFAKNSISSKKYPLLDSISEMFKIIKEEEC